MEREEQNGIQRIYTHPLYVQALIKLKAFEKERIYCRHEETHFLSVARLSYIKWLEAQLPGTMAAEACADKPAAMYETAFADKPAAPVDATHADELTVPGAGCVHRLSEADADAAAGIDLSNAEEIKTLLYAAAFLHDIGRAFQYEDGTPHAQASQALAMQILPDVGFTEAEQAVVLRLIDTHQNRQSDETAQSQNSEYERRLEWLSQLFCEADRQSRSCYCCPAAQSCYWPHERRNHCITE